MNEKLKQVAAYASLESLEKIENGSAVFVEQNQSQATYCKKIKKTDARLDFKEGAMNLFRKIKAFYPSPIAYCNLHLADNSTILRIHQAQMVKKAELESIFDCQKLEKLKCGELIFTKNKLFVCTSSTQNTLSFLQIIKIQLPNKSPIPAHNFVGSTLNQFKKNNPKSSIFLS